MLEVVTHNWLGFIRKEIWFYDGGKYQRVSYTAFCAAQEIPLGECRYVEKYTTSVIDLAKDEKELLDAVHPTYRYDIRSAERHGVVQQLLEAPTSEDCKELLTEYAEFARIKKLSPLRARFIGALRESGCLRITKARADNQVVATHVYICDSSFVSLLASFHSPGADNAKLRSEANKFLHWKDMLYFKARGFKKYDFGGLNHEKLPGISKFKTSFGGTLTHNYRLIQAPPYLYLFISLFKKLTTR